MAMKKRDIAAWVIFAVFTLVVAGLVLLGVSTHEEAGFATPENRWDHMPLTVSCAAHVPGEDRLCRGDASDVVQTVNTRLGFDALRWLGDEDPFNGDIHITLHAPVEVGSEGPCNQPGECYELVGEGTTYTHCEVRTLNLSGSGDLEWIAIYHGLGHCLGLAHDAQNLRSNNIMKPVQRETPLGVLPPWISDSDRALLRERYR